MTGAYIHFATIDDTQCAKCDGALGKGRQLAVDGDGEICYVCAGCAEELTAQGQVKKVYWASWADENDPIIGVSEMEVER